MDRIVVILAIAAGACSRNSPPPARPIANTAEPPRNVRRAEPVSEIEEALAKMSAFRDDMCACRDKSCTDRVTEEMTRWGAEMTKRGRGNERPTEGDTRRMLAISEAMVRCLTAVMVQTQDIPPDSAAPPTTP